MKVDMGSKFPVTLFELEAVSTLPRKKPIKQCWQHLLPMSTNPPQNPTPPLPAEAREVGWGPSRMPCPAHLSLLREIFQMFVSSRCSGAFPPDGDMSSRLVSCSGSQLTAWAWQALLLPYTDCQEPNPCHSPVAAPAWARRDRKGSLGNTPLS